MSDSVHAVFVSDVHLGSLQEPRSILFLDFLRQLQERPITHLFLLGDIFDLWVADHNYFVKCYEPVIEEIKKLLEKGVELHYFEGNHDLYLKHFWSNKLGVNVHEEPIEIQLGQHNFRLEHGDQIDLEDRGYRFLRWFLRTPIMKFIAKNLPGPAVRRIGEKASSKSRTYTSETKTISSDGAIQKIRDHAEKYLPQRNCAFLVSAHLHVRDDYSFNRQGKDYRSINLGTWLDKACYLEYKNSELRLIEV